MMRFWLMFMSMFLPVICWGQIIVKETGGMAAFPLVSSHKTVIYYDAGDYGVVEKTACLLAEDIKRVTNKKVPVSSKKVSSKYAVVVGTVGHNAFIDRLVAEGQLDVSAIRGGWEQFVVKTIDDPAKGVKKVLVIAGCDRPWYSLWRIHTVRGYRSVSFVLVGRCANKKKVSIIY